MKCPSLRAAFTLIELLVVIAIIAVVATFAIPAISSSLRGMQLSQGTQMVADQIRLARQMALTKNHTVEVRFYKYSDPENGGAAGTRYFQAFQSFDLSDDGTVKPIGKMHKIPSSIIMDSGNTLSTLFNPAQVKSWSASDSQVPLPGIGTNYDVYAFQFRADGSADLSVDGREWFFTLHYRIDGDNLQSLPRNFVSIQIDPWNGQSRMFRP